MTVKLSFVVLGIPSLAYYLWGRRRGRSSRDLLGNLGIQGAPLGYVALALVLAVVTPVLFWALARLGVSPVDVHRTMTGLAGYADLPRNVQSFVTILLIEGIGTALGEELLFRGFLGGILMRRLGFAWGNVAQAAIFGAVHLTVLLVAPEYALFAFGFSFAAGLLLGWLYFRTKSIVPSWVTHSVGFPVAVFLLL
jgi:membrane protease YdiL (CAAX protease family)